VRKQGLAALETWLVDSESEA